MAKKRNKSLEEIFKGTGVNISSTQPTSVAQQNQAIQKQGSWNNIGSSRGGGDTKGDDSKGGSSMVGSIFKPKKIDATASFDNLDNLRQQRKELASQRKISTGSQFFGGKDAKIDTPTPATKSQLKTLDRQIQRTIDKQNASYERKYANSNKRSINAAMRELAGKTDKVSQHEYNWLRENQYRYWTANELKSGIAEAERKAAKAKQDRNSFLDYDVSTMTEKEFAEYQKKAKAGAAESSSKSEAAAMRRALENLSYAQELDKFSETEKKMLLDYGREMAKSDNAYSAAQGAQTMGSNPFLSLIASKQATPHQQKAAKVVEMLEKKGYDQDEIGALLRYSTIAYNQETAKQMAQDIKDLSDKGVAGKAIASAASVPMNLAGGVAGTLDLAAQRIGAKTDPFTGERQSIDFNSRGQTLGNTAQMIRSTISEDMGSLGSFLYNTGMSIADFIAVSGTGGVGAEVLLGSSAAQSAAQEAHRRGATDDQALMVGLTSGVAEALFEHVSLDKLKAFQTAAKGTRLTAGEMAASIGKQSIVEGSEEAATTLANTFTDAMIMADKSQINQAIKEYQAQGFSEADATRQAWTDWAIQLGLDALGGALSGGVTGGGTAAVTSAGNYLRDTRTGVNIGGSNYAAAVKADVESGMLFPKSSQTYKQAAAIMQKLANDGQPTGHELGKLHNLIREDMRLGFAPKSDRGGVGHVEITTGVDGKEHPIFVLGPITQAFSDTGLGIDDAMARADVLQDMIDGETVTNKQLKNQLRIFTPETKQVFESLTGKQVPDGLKMAEALDFYRTAITEFRDQQDEAAMIKANADEQATQLLDEAMSEYEQEQEQAVNESELPAPDEIMGNESELPAPEEPAGNESELPERYPRAETRDEFAARYTQALQETEGITPTEKQIEKAWREFSEDDGILLTNGEYVGRAEFYKETAEWGRTRPENRIDYTDDQLEQKYQIERADSRIKPVDAAAWGRTEKTTEEQAPVEEAPAEEQAPAEEPAQVEETQAEDEPAATVLSVSEEAAEPSEPSEPVAESTPAEEEVPNTEQPAESRRNPLSPFAEQNIEKVRAYSEQERARRAEAEKKSTQQKKTSQKKQTVIPTKAEAEASRSESATVTKVTEKKARKTSKTQKAEQTDKLPEYQKATKEEPSKSGRPLVNTKAEEKAAQKKVFGSAFTNYIHKRAVASKAGNRSPIIGRIGKQQYISLSGVEIIPITDEMADFAADSPAVGGLGAKVSDSAKSVFKDKVEATYDLITDPPIAYTSGKNGRTLFGFKDQNGDYVYFDKDFLSYFDGALLYLQRGGGRRALLKAVNTDGTVRGWLLPNATGPSSLPNAVKSDTKLKSFAPSMTREYRYADTESGPNQVTGQPKVTAPKPVIPTKEQADTTREKLSLSQPYGGLAMTEKKISYQMQSTIEMMRKLFKPLGIDAIIFDSESLGPTRNASIKDDPKLGRVIRINENRMNNAELIYWAVGHELTHPSSDSDATLAKDIVDTLSQLAKSGALEGDLAELILDEFKDPDAAIKSRANTYAEEYLRDGLSDAQVKKLTTDDEMRVETAGDWMGYVFSSQPVLERLAGVKPDLMTRIIRAIDRFRGVEVNQLVKNGKGYRQTLKALDDLVDRVHDALEKSAGEKTNSGEKYSLASDTVITPTNGGWEQSRTSAWIREHGYDLYGDTGKKPKYDKDGHLIEEQHPTQNPGATVASYQKYYDMVKEEHPDNWKDLRVLDASSGYGLGTQLGRDEGFNVTDAEPYPAANKDSNGKYVPRIVKVEKTGEIRPAYRTKEGVPDYGGESAYTDMIQEGKKFDVILSNCVLNVVPQDQRNDVLLHMRELLAPGGEMFINVRSDKDIGSKSNGQQWAKDAAAGKPKANVQLDKDGLEWFLTRTKAYQKGFAPEELRAYVSDVLGPGYRVEVLKKTTTGAEFGGNAAVVHVVQDGRKYSATAPKLPVVDGREYGPGERLPDLRTNTPAKSKIQRTTRGAGIGKEIGGTIYIHKDYATTLIPEAEYNKAVEALKNWRDDPSQNKVYTRKGEAIDFSDFDFNSVMYNPKTGAIRFDEAADFDTAREPLVGRIVTFTPDGEGGYAIKMGYSPYIWHHKWQWVDNDYQGFDVGEAYDWSKRWLAELTEPSDGNGLERWNAQLDKYGLPHDDQAGTKYSATAPKLPSAIAADEDRLRAIRDEYRQLQDQRTDLEQAGVYQELIDSIGRVGKEELQKLVDRYNEWADTSGYDSLVKQMEGLSGEMSDLQREIARAKRENLAAAREEYRAQFTPEFAAKYATKAARKFGTTSRFDLAGYLTTNGSLLDFSEGQGYRVQDHREIADVLDFLPDGHEHSDGLIEFMNLGNVRLQSYGIDIAKMPNAKQIPVLRRFFNSLNGEVTVDLSREDGSTIDSIEYPEGTRADRILADLKRFFDTGELPEISDTQRFHYSAVGPVTGFYNLSERVLADVKQDKLGAASVVNMLRGKGVKAEEIKWLGIEDFLKGKKSVTKQELLDWIAANDLVLEEETLNADESYGRRNTDHTDTYTGEVYESFEDAYAQAERWAEHEGYSPDDVRIESADDDRWVIYAYSPELGETTLVEAVPVQPRGRYAYGAGETRWSEYTTPGGTNYRELLLRLPNSNYSNQASDTHWGKQAPGVLAHARVQDFTDLNGRRLLFVDEIQSDWHNEGQEKGYQTKGAEPPRGYRLLELERQLNNPDQQTRLAAGRAIRELQSEAAPGIREAMDAMREELDNGPAAEVVRKLAERKFSGNTEWAKNNFESSDRRLAWGDLSRDGFIDPEDIDVMRDWHNRFDDLRTDWNNALWTLRDEGHEYEYRPPDAPYAKNYTDFVLKRLLREAAENGYDGVAWTTADMQADRWSDAYSEGYRIEYDQDIPKFLNKFGKKFGAKVGETVLDNGDDLIDVPFIPVTDEMRESILENGMPKFSVYGENPAFDAYMARLQEKQRERYLQANPPTERVSVTNSTNRALTDEEKKKANLEPRDRTHTEVKDPAMAQMASMRLDANYDGEKQRLFGTYNKWDAADLATAESIIKQEIEKARETDDYSEARRLIRMHDHQMSDWGLAGHTARNFGHSFAGIVTDATDILDKAAEHEPVNQGKRNKARKVVDGVSQAGKDALNQVRREIEQASNETPGARPSNRRGDTDANGRPVIPSKETVERNKQNRGKAKGQEQEGEGNQGRNMINEPFTFEYADAVGTAIGNSIMKRDEQTEKAKTFLQELQSHIMRYVTEKLPKRKTKKPMTPTELLREYVQNRSFYEQAWTLAQDEVRRQLEKKGIEETPEELKEFLEGWYNIDSTGTPQGKLLRAAITHAALASNETTAKIRERAAVGVNVAEEIANDLIRETGAKGDIALTIRQAAGLYVDDVLARGVKNNNVAGNGAAAQTKALDKMVNSALREIGRAIDENTGPKSMSKLGATSAASKAVVRDSVIRTLMNKYAVSQADAENVANIIGKRFDALLQEGMQKRLESLFKEKKRPDKTKQQSFLDRVIELTNLGAMDSKDYHDAAVAKLLDGYTTRRGTTVDEVLKKVYDYADRLDRIPEGDVAGLKDIITKLNAERWTGGLIKGNEIHRTLRNAINTVASQPGGERFLRQLAAAQIRGIANDNSKITATEAIGSIRYLSMLSKLTTTMRNLVGNTTFDLTETISNDLGTPLDVLLSKITGRRTTTLDLSYASAAKRKGMADAARRAYIEVALDAPIEDGQNRWEMKDGRTFRMAKPNNPNALNVPLNFAERLLSSMEKWQRYLLTVSDEFYKGGIRDERQRGIDRLKARGLLEEDALQNEAQQVALERTFQNRDRMASALDSIRGALDTVAGVKDYKGNRIGLGTALMPFARVPANIAGQVLNYSPAGLIKAVGEVAAVVKAGKKATAEQQAKAVRDFGRGVNGTALITLFALAALKGALKRAGSGDDDEDALLRDMGHTGVQLNLDSLQRILKNGDPTWQKDDTLVALGGIEPLNGPMAFGALLADSIDDESAWWAKIGNANWQTAMQAMADLPAMSSINNIINAYKYSDEKYDAETNPNGGPLKQAADAAATGFGDFAGSFVPNILGGIASGVDEGKTRTTRTSDKRGLEAIPEEMLNQAKLKIPGLRSTLPQALDSFGQPRQTTATKTQNWLNTNVLPLAINSFQPNPVSQELIRLREAGEKVTLPPRNAIKTVDTADGESRKLTESERRKYQETAGGLKYDTMLEAMNNKSYGNETDEFRARVWSDVASYANAMGKQAVGGKATVPTWSQKGTGSVADRAIDYGYYQRMNDVLPEDGVTTGRKMQELLKYANGDEQMARDLFAQLLDNNQSRGTLKKIDYLHKSSDQGGGGGYSYEQIAKFYNAKNEKSEEFGLNKNGEPKARTKAKLIEWATANGFTQAQANWLYKVFNGDVDIP